MVIEVFVTPKRAVEGQGTPLRAVEGHEIPLRAMKHHGGLWNTVEGH